MNRSIYTFGFVAIALAGLSGCSSEPAKEAAKTVAAPDKIQGRAQVIPPQNAQDAALNAGGQSLFLWVGLKRYRLFVKSPVDVTPGKEYAAEGILAQRVIDEIGDPDNGKNGYPLQASCEKVVRMAWPGLAFDVTDGNAAGLRATVKRYPARGVLLVNKITLIGDAKKEDDEDLKEITVPADKQKAQLVESAPAVTAPLWEPAGGTTSCKVLIGKDGKIEELQTGAQLCEAVDWSKYRYQPPVQGGKPVKIKTEVEVKFEPRK